MPRKRLPQPSSNFRLRLAVFAVIALALAGAAVYALWPKTLATTDRGVVDVEVKISMEGFTPATITIPSDRTARIRLVNPDNSHHSDGGGVHQFAVTKLGIDAKIQPLTTSVITIPPSAPGDYAFYCDTCCGGKENPSMQGMLRIRA